MYDIIEMNYESKKRNNNINVKQMMNTHDTMT